MDGKVILLTGAKGSGKTTLIKTKFLISKKNKLAYTLIGSDLNIPSESNFNKYLDKAVFLNNTIFIVDEASTAIPWRRPDPTKREFDRKLVTWFLNSRKCNNYIFIVYHSIEEIPHWLIKYLDYILRFRTTDLLQYQIQRFKSFDKIVESLKSYPHIQNFEYDEIKLQ